MEYNTETTINGIVARKTPMYLIVTNTGEIENPKSGKWVIKLTSETRPLQVGDKIENLPVYAKPGDYFISGKWTDCIYVPIKENTEIYLQSLDEIREQYTRKVRELFEAIRAKGGHVPERLADRMRELDDQEGLVLLQRYREFLKRKKINPDLKPRNAAKKRGKQECVAEYVHIYVSGEEGKNYRIKRIIEKNGKKYAIAYIKEMDVPTPESIAAGFTTGGYYNLFCYPAEEGRLIIPEE